MPKRTFIVVVVALMLLALGAVAPLATAATEASVKAELVSLELRPKKGVAIYAEIHPLLGVAVIEASMGVPEEAARGERYGAVEYAAHIPKGPLEGRLDVTVPGIMSIVGELPADPENSPSVGECSDGEEWTSEGEFRGSFEFQGNSRYLSFHARAAEAIVQQASSPDCEMGRPPTRSRHPSLFGYLHSELRFSNSYAQILDSEVSLPGRHTSFLAKRATDYSLSAFAAETVERLPRHVAGRRYVEVAKASGRDFVPGSKAEFPESAKVRPPRPFSGSATFQRGDADAKGRGLLTGPLYADIFGVRVRLDAREGYAQLFNIDPGF